MKRFLLKSFLLLFLIGALGLVVSQFYPGTFKGLFRSKEFTHSRTTTIKIHTGRRRSNGLSLAVHPYDYKGFLNTQINIMLSDAFLKKVIDDYQLDTLWQSDKTNLLDSIKQQLKLTVNTADLVEINTFAYEDERAQQLAYAVTMTYLERRASDLRAERTEIIKQLNEKIKFQEEKVAKLHKELQIASKKYAIPYMGINSTPIKEHHEKLKKPHPLQQKFELKKRKVQDLENFVKSLEGIDDKSLLTRIIDSKRPEAERVQRSVKVIHEFKKAKQDLVNLDSSNSKLTSLQAKIIEAEKKQSSTLRQIREQLSKDLIASRYALAEFKIKADINSVESIEYDKKIKAKHAAFNKIKDEYEREFRVLQSIKLAELEEVITPNLAIDPVTIKERGWTFETATMMKARKQ